jgi:hypothetical protein
MSIYVYHFIHNGEEIQDIQIYSKVSVSVDNRDKRDKRSGGGWVYVRCLLTFLWQTFNVINLFRSYEQRSCSSAGPHSRPAPSTDSLPDDGRYGTVFLRIVFCVESTCSISLPFPYGCFWISQHIISYCFMIPHTCLCLSFICNICIMRYISQEFLHFRNTPSRMTGKP